MWICKWKGATIVSVPCVSLLHLFFLLLLEADTCAKDLDPPFRVVLLWTFALRPPGTSWNFIVCDDWVVTLLEHFAGEVFYTQEKREDHCRTPLPQDCLSLLTTSPEILFRTTRIVLSAFYWVLPMTLCSLYLTVPLLFITHHSILLPLVYLCMWGEL